MQICQYTACAEEVLRMAPRKLDPITGRLLPIEGKSDLMRRVEARLGRTLEQDYLEFYMTEGHSQRELAKRWGVNRHLVFERTMRGNRRCWVDWLRLPRRDEKDVPDRKRAEASRCSLPGCNEADHLDSAHWIAAASGGPTGWNLVRLCPNHHRALDRGDPEVAKAVEKVALYQAVQSVLQDTKLAEPQKIETLHYVVRSVLARKADL